LYWKGGGGFGRLEMASVVGIIATRLPEDETTPKPKPKPKTNPRPTKTTRQIENH
jgi:hypothetical protein